MTETPTPTTPVETIRKALLGYRVMAWTTGLWLILLCYEMVAKYVYHVEGMNWIAVVHGWVYFIYLLFTANLAVKVRWPIAEDHRCPARGHHPARRHHRRALPDQGHQGQVRHLMPSI